ncbi:MAG: DUF2764 family protein [Rikenellaceae bacterium]|nr:DUF2764 family protein [Rikenellaceae bacterium]
MAKQYYCLVASLREYTLDTDRKGFDAVAIRREIEEELSDRDRETVRLFYRFYDIENLVSRMNGRSRFNALGNLTEAELAEAIEHPAELPPFMRDTLDAYRNPDNAEYEDTDTSVAIEHTLLTRYYETCARSRNRFVREWYAFDQNLRNVCAAYAARKAEIPVESVTVGRNEITDALARSSAADFGLRGELDYLDPVVAAMQNDENLVDKEHKIDMIRWNMADELTTFDYFDLNRILAYLVKVNIIHRWAALDPERGRAMYDRLIAELSSRDILEQAEENKE